jgi:hypothetical protein
MTKEATLQERRKRNTKNGKGNNSQKIRNTNVESKKERVGSKTNTRKTIGKWESGVHLELGFLSM